MTIPPRLLRASAAEFIPPHPSLTTRERAQRETIMHAGRTMMAQFGRHAIRMVDFAAAIRLSPPTIRRHFTDLDNLLATILREHLMQIVTAIGAVPRTAPNRLQARRAAYLGATRTGLGAPSETHLLLIRDRQLLPADELASIEAIRDNIGEILAGPHAALALALLDTPQIHPSRMEAALAALLATPLTLDTPPTRPAEAPPEPIAPFVPLLRPLRPNPQPGATPLECPTPAPWERATPPPQRLNRFASDGLTEALRRASS